MSKTLEELEIDVKAKGWHSVENALNLVNTYINAYTEYKNKYEEMVKVFNALKEILPTNLIKLIEEKLNEDGI